MKKISSLLKKTRLLVLSMSTLAIMPLQANWSRNLQIFNNAGYGYVLVNRLRANPTKATLCMAGLSIAAGYVAGQWLNQDQDYADAYIGHAIGIPLALVPENPKRTIYPTLETIGALGGGFLLGTSLRHLVDSLSKEPISCPRELYTFADLAGTIPQDIREVTDFINKSEKYRAIGAHMPKGILLVGPPGTGKTSIARAIAGEVNAHFFPAKGTQFVEQWVGLGASRVRELFTRARAAVKNGTCKKAIIFIDEIDALGSRGTNIFGGSTEYKTTMNELLCQLDGFEQDDSIFIIAATNRVQDLDPALTRSGRFDRIVTIDLPNQQSREAILRLHAQKIKTDTTVNFALLAQKTPGLNCADLRTLINEAAIHAVRENAELVNQSHFDKVFQTNEKYRNADTKKR